MISFTDSPTTLTYMGKVYTLTSKGCLIEIQTAGSSSIAQLVKRVDNFVDLVYISDMATYGLPVGHVHPTLMGSPVVFFKDFESFMSLLAYLFNA